MSNINRIEQITSWKRVLNAARRTIGKKPLDKEPSDKWKAQMLLAEHSPIRLLEFDWSWHNIKQYVTAHITRHFLGTEKFVHSQRGDRRNLLEEYGVQTRDELPQGALNDMDMSANAQALINISRKRLCNCASKETREAWIQVINAVREIDPVLADKCVPECQYRNFCPEWMSCCGYVYTDQYKIDRLSYLRTDYNDQWTPIKGYEGLYEISRFGMVKSLERVVEEKTGKPKTISEKILKYHINKERNGYCYVSLSKDGISKYYQIHRLVAEHFIPNPDDKPQVNHIDGNKINNQVSNLEWVTDIENKRHAWDSGLAIAEHRKCKIQCIQTGEIFESIVDCSQKMNIDRRSIFRQLKGEKEFVKGYSFIKL